MRPPPPGVAWALNGPPEPSVDPSRGSVGGQYRSLHGRSALTHEARSEERAREIHQRMARPNAVVGDHGHGLGREFIYEPRETVVGFAVDARQRVIRSDLVAARPGDVSHRVSLHQHREEHVDRAETGEREDGLGLGAHLGERRLDRAAVVGV